MNFVAQRSEEKKFRNNHKEHNKQLHVYRAGIILMTWISTFTRETYLKEENYFKLVAIKVHFNYFDGRKAINVLARA